MKLILKLKEKWKAAAEEQKKIDEFQTMEERKSERNAFLLIGGAGLVAGVLSIILLLAGIPPPYLYIGPIVMIVPGIYSVFKIYKVERATNRRYEASLHK